jgi:hypothetical protein
MINNMHMIDRIVRIIIALVILYFYFWGSLTGLAAIILLIIAAALLITGISGYCPIYHILGMSTKGK